MTEIEYMKLAVEQANENIVLKEGGPFGAVIVRNQEVVAAAHNRVLVENDPTAHAEITAIRKACQYLNSYDLSECVLYTSCYPCPMCLSAAIWANIKTVYYANTAEDAGQIGFRDDFIYHFIENGAHDDQIVKMSQIGREQAIETFNDYVKDPSRESY